MPITFQPSDRICTDAIFESDDSNNLVSFYRWETPDKHITKIQIREPFEEAAARFKKSIISFKSHIYSKRVQNPHYNLVKGLLDHAQILVHVDYAESTRTPNKTRFKVLTLETPLLAFLQHAATQNR